VASAMVDKEKERRSCAQGAVVVVSSRSPQRQTMACEQRPRRARPLRLLGAPIDAKDLNK
jgi:hypothetical protein